LRTVREAAGRTQVEVAQESQMDQADISRLERRGNFDDCQVATLQRYVKALGGELELVARFGDKKIAIVGAQPSAASTTPDNKALQRTGRKPSRR
jgi:transcriptional regulator with XRE-family HTH domain